MPRKSGSTSRKASENRKDYEVREQVSKRFLDIVLAVLGLVICSPLWAVIYVSICLEDGFPVHFTQERSGKGGRVFRAIKFRTMRRQRVGEHLVEDVAGDPRVTKVGRVLRTAALDELPQLINILRGDMSLVGPRALYPRIETKMSPEYGRRIQEIPGFYLRSLVRPGLTGLAQIYAHKDATYRNKFRYDNIYVKNMGLCLDLKLILLSFWRTLVRRWGPKKKRQEIHCTVKGKR